MLVDGVARRTIWDEDGQVRILNQRPLPHRVEVLTLETLEDAARAIRSMEVRGAPLIGVAAAYGMVLAMRSDPSDAGVTRAARLLADTRPTAINLQWALDRVRRGVAACPPEARAASAMALARAMADEDVACNQALGEHALALFRLRAEERERGGNAETPLRILTHCNAGWLATVDRGTATAGIYAARDAGLPVHVWVDETRPRGQGRRLTAWELGQEGIGHAVVPDTAAGHLMATGQVDLVITGTDRVAANGDVVNKIGTYQVALAAADNGVPFYVATPWSSVDLTVPDGRSVPIEERSADEVHWVSGPTRDAGGIQSVRVTPHGSEAVNYAFDATPARLVTRLVTDRGVIPATSEALAALSERPAGVAE